MKKLFAILIIVIVALNANFCFSQTDKGISLVKLIYNNSGDSLFYPSQKLKLLNTENKGIILSAVISNNGKEITGISCNAKKLDEICKGVTLLYISFQDDSKIILFPLNEADCDSELIFNIDDAQIKFLTKKMMKGVMISNESAHVRYTGMLKDSNEDYYMQIFSAILNRKIITEYEK